MTPSKCKNIDATIAASMEIDKATYAIQTKKKSTTLRICPKFQKIHENMDYNNASVLCVGLTYCNNSAHPSGILSYILFIYSQISKRPTIAELMSNEKRLKDIDSVSRVLHLYKKIVGKGCKFSCV